MHKISTELYAKIQKYIKKPFEKKIICKKNNFSQSGRWRIKDIFLRVYATEGRRTSSKNDFALNFSLFNVNK